MATFYNTSRFRVFHGILWLFFTFFLKKSVGDTVHLMSVTPTPYGASQAGTKFICLLSDPDIDVLDNIFSYRHVLRGSNYNTLTVPQGTTVSINPFLKSRTITLPTTIESQGVYFCQAFSRELATRVPVPILASNRRFQPANGKFTVTSNVGDRVFLTVDNLLNVQGSAIYWEKQSDNIAGFVTIQTSGTALVFNSVSVVNAGVYATYWNTRKNDFLFSLIRVIVRECVHGRWGAPLCTGICDNCYNGGICDDKTGECVCRPGFSGPNCLTACGQNRFGWNCEHLCDVSGAVTSCVGSVFCMPDPVGCSCMTGYIGAECNAACPNGKFGAGCTVDCNCALGFCNRFTGECTGSCNAGWLGTSCQIPTSCPLGLFGDICTILCHCLNGAGCDKETGKCNEDFNTGLSLCEPGYVSSTGVNLDNCQTYEGCFDSCTKTCHCNFGSSQCDSATGVCLNGCKPGWNGASCQIVLTCPVGYFGDMCTILCHCLNGAACDQETGKCDEDFNTGLSLCETGYGSSTGVNLDNCQTYEGCFDSCTKTCHCNFGSSQCDSATDVCMNGCKPSWTGAFCQIGIVEFTYLKTNPSQLVSVTCTVTGDPVLLANNVHLSYHDDENGQQNIQQIQAETKGMFLVVNYESNFPQDASLNCIVSVTDGGQFRPSHARVTIDYYDLPSLNKPPSAESIFDTSVLLKWDAWNTNDSGDGPVIAYNVYYTESGLGRWELGFHLTATLESVIVAHIGSLQPVTPYLFYVTVIREGDKGEGLPSPYVIFTTTETQPEPPTTPTIPTTRAPITTPVPITTTPSITTKAPPPTLDMTTQKLPTDPKTPVGRTSAVSGITEPGVINTVMAGTPKVTTSPTTKSQEGTAAPTSGNDSPIIIAVVVALVVVLIFIIAFVWLLKRKQNRVKRYPPSIVASEADLDRLSTVLPSSVSGMVETCSISTLDGIDNMGMDLDDGPEIKPRPLSDPPAISTESTPSVMSRPVSSPMATASIKTRLRIPPVNIKDYPMYVKTKRQTSDLKVEYESLPKDLARPTSIAKKIENKGKNRYRNVVAYDHSRVVLEPLEDDPDSDYVNACYIKGIKNPKAYIASQGPTEPSVKDFWRMIWQENISIMIMACNLFEEGRPKCAKYWPEKGSPVAYCGITITFDSEVEKEEYYLIRKFIVSKDGEGASRELLQFHYTKWPDKDVPRHCTPVIRFINDFKTVHDWKTPILIHCSAGAGRTGAIIASHAMMELAEDKGQVDIYNFVFSMRNSRPNIVQTAGQYIFVHDVMLEYLFCKNTFIPANVFASKLKALKDQNPETGNTYLEDEYEILKLVSPNLVPDKTRGSLKPENTSKIRSSDSLPVDSSRLYLMTPRGDDDQSPYINAAYMDGYKKKDLFISTQMPLENTVVDLWRMMYDYDCTCLVVLDPLDPDDKDCPQFWPNAGTNEYGPFTVSLMDKDSTADFEMRTLQLVYTKRDVKSPLSVRLFRYLTWPKGEEQPESSHGMLQLISAVEKWQKTVGEPGPIVVLCMNAAGRSGTFCTIQTALDQVREEQGVDVLQNVKELRIHRTNMVDTPAKYVFCYETILEYLKAFDNYDKKDYVNLPDSSKQEKKKQEEENHLYGNIPSTGTHSSAADKKPLEDAKLLDAPSASAEGLAKPSAEGGANLPAANGMKSKGSKKGLKFSTKGLKFSTKGSNKPSKKSTNKQEQHYQNIMFDTKL